MIVLEACTRACLTRSDRTSRVRYQGVSTVQGFGHAGVMHLAILELGWEVD